MYGTRNSMTMATTSGGRRVLLGVLAFGCVLFLVAGAVHADVTDIVIDSANISTTTSSGTTTFTWSHTVNATLTNRYLVVCFSLRGNTTSIPAVQVSSVSYGGNALTRRVSQDSNGTQGRTEIWDLLAPPTGSNTVSVTLSTSTQVVASAVAFGNVNQTSPSRSSASTRATSSSISLSITSNSRDAIIDVVSSLYPITPTPGSAQTLRWNTSVNTNLTDLRGSGSTKPGVASLDAVGWALSSLTSWSICAESIQPPNTPSLARFAAADVVGTDSGTIIMWRTGYEVNNLGFRIYREDASGNRVLITPSVVAGSALFAGPAVEMASGRAYTFVDRRATLRSAARYWIEAIDLDGSSRWHGPFTARPASADEEARLVARLGMKFAESPTLSALGSGLRSPAAGERPRVASSRETGPVEAQWLRAAEAGAKILVDHEGWYRVTRGDLANAGFDPGPDPTTLHLFAEGVEQAIRVTGMDDGYFDVEDAIEFYGLGLDTPATDTRVYWVTVDDRPGLRIWMTPPFVGERPTRFLTVYPATVERRDRSIYVASVIQNGDRDNFYAGVVSPESLETTLHLDNMDAASFDEIPPRLRVSLQGITDGDHDVLVELNDRVVGEMSFEGNEAAEAVFDVADRLTPADNVVRLTSRAGDGDVSVLDAVSVIYPRAFVVRDDALSLTAQRHASIDLLGFEGKVPTVMDVSDPDRPVEVPGEILDAQSPAETGYRVVVPGTWSGGDRDADLYAFSEKRIEQPVDIMVNQPSAWHGERNRADLVIISHPVFLEAAELLAGHRRMDGLTVAVVSLEDVYDEFSFGEKSPEAIRSFLTQATGRWEVAPRYVVLLGDASFDPRDHLGMGVSDFVPTHIQATMLLKTASDDWFGEVDGSASSTLAIGRIPARTPAAALVAVEKIIAYDAADGAGWADRIMLVADQDGEEFSFEKAIDELASLVPADVETENVLIGRMGEETARQEILEAFTTGRLIINYQGHGSQTIWTNHGVLEISDVENMTNADRLPVVLAMNCLNGLFHDVQQQSLAEALLLEPDGGAVAVWASSALTDPEGQARLNEVLYEGLFGDANSRVGDAIVAAKAAITDPYVRSSWVFFGDPSMRLKR